MAKKRVFVSFDYEYDKNYKLLLQAWDANQNFNFNFNDQSITVPINSDDSSRIKAGITTKMKDSTYCLIIIGKHTHKSEWVNYEIENANKLGLKLIAVKIDKNYKTPPALYNKNASWAMKFGQNSIQNAIDKKSNTNRKTFSQSQYIHKSKSATCKRCGRPLTNQRSIQLGYGPLCLSKIR
ncbi:MAG: TIR domain-containing protein [Spirochaetes bacterium]|nr:TIR domain-containing protein [Spirochaetota bacterium]